MELFTWLWSYDKRLLYAIKYGSHTFVYIWLIPTVISATVLFLSSFQQIIADRQELDHCLHQSNDKEVKQGARLLKTLMLIQEGILISVFFAGLLSLIIADRIFKSEVKTSIPQTFIPRSIKKAANVAKAATDFNNDKDRGSSSNSSNDDKEAQPLEGKYGDVSLTINRRTTEYDFQLRNDTRRSVPAKLLLTLAWVNYFFSFAFKDGYDSYLESGLKQGQQDCVVPGAFTLATYSVFLVMGSGSLLLGYITLGYLFKIVHLIPNLICPNYVVCCKKHKHKVPRDFSHYENEFNFDCTQEAPCWQNQDDIDGPNVTHGAADAEVEFKSVQLPDPESLILGRNDSVRKYDAEDRCLVAEEL